MSLCRVAGNTVWSQMAMWVPVAMKLVANCYTPSTLSLDAMDNENHWRQPTNWVLTGSVCVQQRWALVAVVMALAGSCGSCSCTDMRCSILSEHCTSTLPTRSWLFHGTSLRLISTSILLALTTFVSGISATFTSVASGRNCVFDWQHFIVLFQDTWYSH